MQSSFRSTEDEPLPRWEADRAEFCARIERVRSPLKIVLKTKNYRSFIARWIAHHAAIVGLENLIIFDNMSDDPEALAVYREFSGRVDIVQFDDRYWNLHHSGLYADLYRALANSAEYFIFIDVDEFLVLIDDATFCADARIVDFVTAHRGFDLFPATWMFNKPFSDRRFFCGREPRDVADRLACGKPLVRSSKMPAGYVNHNFQLSTAMFAPPFKTGLFLLHLTNLYPQQRILANVQKLVTEGVARPGETPESIAARTDIADEVLAGYAAEIRNLLAAEPHGERASVPLESGELELSPDGAVSYYSEVERGLMKAFLADPRAVYERVPDHYRLAAVP